MVDCRSLQLLLRLKNKTGTNEHRDITMLSLSEMFPAWSHSCLCWIKCSFSSRVWIEALDVVFR